MNKKQQVTELWHTCFGDSEDFIDLYFNQVYQDTNTLTIEENGQIISALQMLPYTMTYYGSEISVAYICGVCTRPEARSKGLMKHLFENAFKEMRKRNMTITVLIPAEAWLFDYYRKLGYIEAFDYSTETYARPQSVIQKTGITVISPESSYMNTLYAYFDKKIKERTCCILHSFDDFKTIVQDLQSSKSQMLAAFNENQQPVGLIFPYLYNNTDGQNCLYIKELIYDNEDVKSLLLQEAAMLNNVERATYETLPIQHTAIPKGMAKILDAKSLIPYWLSAHPQSRFSKNDLEKMDIQTLTQLLLDYSERKAFMSLMLE